MFASRRCATIVGTELLNGKVLALNVGHHVQLKIFYILNLSRVIIAFFGNQQECGCSENLLPFMVVWQNKNFLELDPTSMLSCVRQFPIKLDSMNKNKSSRYNLCVCLKKMLDKPLKIFINNKKTLVAPF